MQNTRRRQASRTQKPQKDSKKSPQNRFLPKENEWKKMSAHQTWTWNETIQTEL